MRLRIYLCVLALSACNDGGGSGEPDAGFDTAAAEAEAEAYLAAEQDLVQRFCAAVLSCCTDDEQRALSMGIAWHLSVGTDMSVEDCVEIVAAKRDDVDDWRARIAVGSAVFDRDAHMACAMRVATVEGCGGAGFSYPTDCPVFARGDGVEGDECLGSIDRETTVCGPGLWCDGARCVVSRGEGAPCVETDDGFELIGPQDPGTERDEVCGAGLTCQRGLGCAPPPGTGAPCDDTACATGNQCVFSDDDDERGVCESVDLACRGRE